MSMSDPIIETDALTRTFARRGRGLTRTTLTAVNQLTVRVQPGGSVGYVGANGAGKSTTIKMLVGILVPTSGTGLTCGLQPLRDRKSRARRIGVVFGQRSQLWPDLPVRESFAIRASIHGLPASQRQARTKELIDQLEMGDYLSAPVRQLSLGQRMRTGGHHGTLAFDGPLAGLSSTLDARRVLVVDLAVPTPPLTGIPGTTHLDAQSQGPRQRLSFDSATTTAAQVLAEVSTRADVRDLAIEEPDIEDVVRSSTGGRADG